jgi:hypothetical protein
MEHDHLVRGGHEGSGNDAAPVAVAGDGSPQSILALCLMVAIVIADRAVDQGARRRRTYVLAAGLASLAGALVSTPFELVWRDYVLLNRWPAEWHWLHPPTVYFFSPIFC